MTTNITWALSWQAVDSAVRYELLEYNVGTKVSSLLGTAASSVTSTGLTVDESMTKVVQARGHDGTAYLSSEVFIRGRPAILAALRQEIRRELKDETAGSYRWGDGELDQYIREGLADYSQHFPLETTTSLAATADVRSYSLSNVLRIRQVLFIRNDVYYYLRPKPWRGGEAEVRGNATTTFYDKLNLRVRNSTRYYPGHYSYYADTLELDFDPEAGDTFQVDYGAIHTLPYLDTDAITLDLIDWEPIALYAQAKAWMRVGAQDTALQRWDERGRRDDSPIIPRHTILFNAYSQKLKEKRQSQPQILRRVRV